MQTDYFKKALLSLGMSLLLIACGGSSNNTEEETPSSSTPSTTPSTVPSATTNITVLSDSNLSINENESSTIEVNKNVTITEVSNPTHGTVSKNENTLSYKPEKDFNGQDSFTYSYSNEAGDIKTITVTMHIKDFILYSSNYIEGSKIPRTHVCSSFSGGVNQSPQFTWENAPKKTTFYALIMDDEVSPCGTGDNACKHWGLFNIPSATNELKENLDPVSIMGTVEGKNYMGTNDYEGPCPPNIHIYKTTVYALDSEMPQLSSVNMSRSKFESTYAQYILNSATLAGEFP